MSAVSQISMPPPLLVQSGSQNTVTTGTMSAVIEMASARGGTGCREIRSVIAVRIGVFCGRKASRNLVERDPRGHCWDCPRRRPGRRLPYSPPRRAPGSDGRLAPPIEVDRLKQFLRDALD
jgi:hypothetical protein